MKPICILALTALVSLAGCASPGACDDDRGYTVVEPTRKIETGSDMDPLPPGEELTIPVASTPPDAAVECLERPPNYFDRPIGGVGAETGDGR